MLSAASAFFQLKQRSTHGAQPAAAAWGRSHGRQLARLTQHSQQHQAHNISCPCKKQQMGCKLHIMQEFEASNTASACQRRLLDHCKSSQLTLLAPLPLARLCTPVLE